MRRSYLALLLALLLVVASPAAATTITLSQAALLDLDEVTALFGGNGQVVSRTADGDGVLFEIEGGTIDYGKVAVRQLLHGFDLTPYTDFGLHFDVVSAASPIVLNPFVQTAIFKEYVGSDAVQGDSLDEFVPLGGVQSLDQGYALGFQYFTAGGVVNPSAQTVLLRVTPIAGADAYPPAPMPEPSTGLLLAAALGAASIGGRCAGPSDPR